MDNEERTVTKRQLNQDTATVLASVAVDHPVVVTERGRQEWRISRYDEAPLTGLARLEALGQITPINTLFHVEVSTGLKRRALFPRFTA